MIGNAETIQILNRELLKNPEFQLPVGYKKIALKMPVQKEQKKDEVKRF